MAILKDCPGLQVEVVVNDWPLQEYVDNDEPEAANSVTRYIEAKTGDHFAIKYTFSHPFPVGQGIIADVLLDGQSVRRNVSFAPLPYYPATMLSAAHAKIGTKTFEQKFTFAQLEITEEQSPVNKDFLEKVSELGTIAITFQFCTNVRQKEDYQKDLVRIEDPGVVPEKAMKGDEKSHRTNLAAATTTGDVKYWLWDRLGNGPFATFRFKYRSLNALHALHIVPRPMPLEERGPEVLTPDEKLELKKILEQRDVKPDFKGKLTIGDTNYPNPVAWTVTLRMSICSSKRGVKRKFKGEDTARTADHNNTSDDPVVNDSSAEEDGDGSPVIGTANVEKRRRKNDSRYLEAEE